MWPDRISNPGSLTYESGALPTALRGLACTQVIYLFHYCDIYDKENLNQSCCYSENDDIICHRFLSNYMIVLSYN